MTVVGTNDEGAAGAAPAVVGRTADMASALADTTPRASSPDDERVAELKRELERMSLRLAFTRRVARDVSPMLESDDKYIDVIVEDLVRRWQDGGSAQQRAQPDGLDDFWNWYASQVEFAPSDSEDDFRAGFFPTESQAADMHNYYSAVWRAHIRALSLEAGARAGVAWESADTGTD